MKYDLNKQLDSVFEQAEGLYSRQDIMTAIRRGEMDVVTWQNDFGVVQVLDFPQGRVLECILAVVEDPEATQLLSEFERHAKEKGAHSVRIFGRIGWYKHGKRYGYEMRHAVFTKKV